MKVVIFGVGRFYRRRRNEKCFKTNEIIAFLDNDERKQGLIVDGRTVMSPKCLKQLEYDCVVLMSIYSREMRDELLSLGIPENKMVDYDAFVFNDGRLQNIKNILVFGTGLFFQRRKNAPCLKMCRIKAFLDNSGKKQGTCIDGVRVFSPQTAVDMSYDFIVIMSIYEDEMLTQLIELGIPEGKVLFYRDLATKYSQLYQSSEFLSLEGGYRNNHFLSDNFNEIKIEKGTWNPLVSVIVPNYNHSPYLRQRLDSIYSQTYKNYEVILLDDCSTDDSVDILNEYADKYVSNTKVVINETNSGKVFSQWNKGIGLANGDLIWIAESDDYCDDNFLEILTDKFRQQSIMLAYARSEFVREGAVIWTMEEYLHDMKSIDWGNPFTISAAEVVKKAFALKNIIPNASSAVFRNIGEVPSDVQELWNQLRLCGDWVFYLNVIKGGCISYTTETKNYYRIHRSSTSLTVQKDFEYYKEHELVSKYICKNFHIDKEVFERSLKILKEHYGANHNENECQIIEEYYNIESIIAEKFLRIPNVLMCCFTIGTGGGETYTLYLANALKKRGVSVTLLDFNMNGYDEQIRLLLNPSIPLVRVSDMIDLYNIIKSYDGEIVHSHHGSVDSTVAECLICNRELTCKHVISLHGMYESIDCASCARSIKIVKQTCEKYIYIADKNLVPFIENGVYDKDVNKFIKLPNGLPQIKINPVKREELGIEKEAFVLCLVSRAMPEKGWQEAIDAVQYAQKLTDRPIHLLLIGDGEEYERMKSMRQECIHLLGRRSNVRDYFAMSDAGFLPTRFKGESYPLVVIESLLCGKPVIATNIAEVSNQLADENGELAGVIFEIKDWSLDITMIGEAIIKLATDSEFYHKIKLRTNSAARKFDILDIAKKHCEIYKDVYYN